MERLVPHVVCCIVQAQLKMHAEERERERLRRRQLEGKEELMKKGKQGLYNATHVRQSAWADVIIYKSMM